MVALTQWEICQGGGKVEKYTKTNVKDPYIHKTLFHLKLQSSQK